MHPKNCPKIIDMPKQPDFKYTDIQKIVCDLRYAKKMSNNQIDKQTIAKFGLIEGEWQEIPKKVYMTTAFKEFISKNFDDIPSLIEDNGQTQFFNKKQI